MLVDIVSKNGASWAGEVGVARVTVTTDGGATWAEAEFLDPMQQYAWRRWQLRCITPRTPGRYTLMARAEDALGRLQPKGHDPRYGSYVIDHSLPIEIFVDDRMSSRS